MKKIDKVMLLAGMLLCLLSGCKEKEEPSANGGNTDIPKEILENISGEEGAYDVQVKEEELSLYLEEGQFVMGAEQEEEPVFLIGDKEGNVYSYKVGQEKELLLEGMSSSYVSESVQWWKLGEKYYVVFDRFFNVFHEDGVKAFRVPLADGDRVSAICQTESGRVAVLWYSGETYTTNLMELNTETGEMTSKLALPESYGIAGGAGDGVMIRDRDGIYTYDLKSGEKTWHMKFDKTTYDPMVTGNNAYDFMLTQEGEVILLTRDLVADTWHVETLSKISFEETGKTILVYKINFPSAELKEIVAQFNKENEKYYVYLDARNFEVAYDDYVAQTSIELVVGKGADIIDYHSVDNITSMTEKGVFENLEPYMEKSGMKKEDYFPIAFQDWETGEGCYGLGFSLAINTVYMKEELAKEVTSLETLLDSMENYEEDVVFSKMFQRFPGALLEYFLYMSGDAQSMLDWENGTCDFSGKQWERMMEISLRYGQGEKRPSSEEITMTVFGGTFQDYAMSDMEARNAGMIPLGYPVGDSMVHRVQVDSLCMNAASENKEGVWEFMEYLMSAKSQQTLSKLYFPVLKSEYENVCRKELTNPSIIDIVNYEPVYTSKEQVEMISGLLEGAQAAPLNTEYVNDIIRGEAESYFSGEKTIEQVSEIIENRIGMYLAENQ